MNKETKKLYNWLLTKPGYLKCSIETILEKYPIKTDKIDIWGALKALKEARKSHKNNDEPKSKKIIKKYEILPVQNNTKSQVRNIPGSYLVTICSHAPWHNRLMYKSLFNYLKQEDIALQGLVLGGDFMDLNSLSAHDKGKKAIEGVTLDWEYQETNKFLDEFDALKFTKTATKDYLYGNHEDRYLRLMRNNDESKYGAALKSPEEGLNLSKRGYNVYLDWKNDSIEIGPHLEVCHGEFTNTFASKKMIDTFRKSVIFGHTHRFQIYTEGMVGGWNIGAGADFTSPVFGYATKAMKKSWMNGCAIVYLDSNGFYHVQPMTFINNKLIVNGKEY